MGDAVLYFNRRGYKNRTSKLIKRWQRPYIVKSVTETNALIQLFDDPNSQPQQVYLNNLKIYLGPLVRGAESPYLDIDLELSASNGEPDIDENDGMHANSSTSEEASSPGHISQYSESEPDLAESVQPKTKPDTPLNERRPGLRNRPKKKRDPQFV